MFPVLFKLNFNPPQVQIKNPTLWSTAISLPDDFTAEQLTKYINSQLQSVAELLDFAPYFATKEAVQDAIQFCNFRADNSNAFFYNHCFKKLKDGTIFIDPYLCLVIQKIGEISIPIDATKRPA